MYTQDQEQQIKEQAIETVRHLGVKDPVFIMAAAFQLAYIEYHNPERQSALADQKKALWDIATKRGVSDSQFETAFTNFMLWKPQTRE